MREENKMREILKESLKKIILNYFGFRFSKQRTPLSSYRIKIIIFKEKTEVDDQMRVITEWKEVI